MEDDLYPLYLSQIVSGCDSLECNCPTCASNPKHKPFEGPAGIIAAKYTQEHQYNDRLCPNQSTLLTDPSIIITLSNFKDFYNDFIHNLEIKNRHKATLSKVFTDVGVFSHILMSEDHLLTKKNLYLSDNVLSDYVNTLKTRESIFSQYSKKIISLSKIITHGISRISRVRAHILLFLFPNVLGMELINVIKSVAHFNNIELEIFISTLAKCKSLVSHMACVLHKLIKAHISLSEKNNSVNSHTPTMHAFASFAFILLQANEISENKIKISITSPEFCKILSPKTEFDLFREGQFSYISIPAILTPSFKAKVVNQETLFIQSNNSAARLYLLVGRDTLFADAKRQLNKRRAGELRRRLCVEFKGEPAQDDGGVTREFFHLAAAQLINLFVYRNNTLWFPDDIDIDFDFDKEKDSQEYYTLAGILIGLAILSGSILPLRFPIIFYKSLLNYPISLEDLLEIYPDEGRTLLSLREMSKEGKDDEIADLCLVFAYGEDELVEGGSLIEVNARNAENYIDACIEYLTFKKVSCMLEPLREGFRRCCSSPILSKLEPMDLDTLVSGAESFEWNVLKSAAETDGYEADSETVNDLWTIFDEFDEAKKRAFLRFVTGCDRVPAGGLESVRITIQRSSDTMLLPTAHTCKSILVLPDYRDTQKMRDFLNIVCENAEGLFLV